MGNSELAAHIKKSPSNATYLNPDIQNELIRQTGKEILSSISLEVKNASCFAEIADGISHKLIKSPLSILARCLKSPLSILARCLKSPLSILARCLKGDTLTKRCIGMINQ